MQPDLTTSSGARRALVLGGTGYVGSAVLRELASRGITAVFTYQHSEDKAGALAAELGHTPLRVDLADPAATRAALDSLVAPDIVIHCAAVSSAAPLAELDLATWQRTMAINLDSAYVVCKWLAERRSDDAATDIVLVGGLDRTQSLPLPVHFAATQGALAALVMALAHELGPRGVRVNLVSLGVLGGGISTALAARRKKDYETFSSLRRAGTADEAARAIAWLALDNTFIQGKTIAVNGGI